MKEVSIYFEDKLVFSVDGNSLSLFPFESQTLIYDDKKEIARIPSNYLIVIKDK